MDNTKRIGSITELQVMAELLKYGDVSVPYGNNARYDCILDYNNKFLKIQIKTACRVDENRFTVPFANRRTNRSGTVHKVYTQQDVDFIATYYEGKLYLFQTGKHVNLMTLSFRYPENGIKSTINLAKNYEADFVLHSLSI